MEFFSVVMGKFMAQINWANFSEHRRDERFSHDFAELIAKI